MPSELVKRIRAKYPSDYSDLSDADLESKILAKYPEYKDLATPAVAAKAPSYGQDVLSTLKGEAEGLAGGLTAPILHPIDSAVALYNTVRHPIDTATGIGRVLSEGSAEDIGKLYGNVASGAILGKVAPKLPTMLNAPAALSDALEARTGVRPMDVAKGTAKGVLTSKNPLLKPILRAITDEAADRVAALVEHPKNVQAAFKAVSAAAAKRGVTLSVSDINDVAAALEEPESVRLSPMEPDTWTRGTTGAPSHATGSASYGPYGDLKAWLTRRFNAQDAKAIQADPNVKALLDQFGRPMHP